MLMMGGHFISQSRWFPATVAALGAVFFMTWFRLSHIVFRRPECLSVDPFGVDEVGPLLRTPAMRMGATDTHWTVVGHQGVVLRIELRSTVDVAEHLDAAFRHRMLCGLGAQDGWRLVEWPAEFPPLTGDDLRAAAEEVRAKLAARVPIFTRPAGDDDGQARGPGARDGDPFGAAGRHEGQREKEAGEKEGAGPIRRQ